MTIKIDPKAVATFIFILISAWLLWQIRGLALVLFIAFIISSALVPAVKKLEERKFSRLTALVVVYFLLITFLILLGVLIIPPMVTQTQRFASNLPSILESVARFLGLEAYADQLTAALLGYASTLSGYIVKITVGIFSNTAGLITVLIFAFYFLWERSHLKDKLFTVFPKKQKKLESLLDRIEKQLGAYVRGQLALAFIVGTFSYIGLMLLGVNYALSLALIAGVLEIFPIIGPIISMIIAALVGLSISPLMGLSAAALFFLIQQLENNILVPRVTKQTVGLDPLVTLLALAIGGRLAGIGGALLAVPVTVTGKVIIEKLTEEQKSV
jgi:predicted PurR-regulated permease PerM